MRFISIRFLRAAAAQSPQPASQPMAALLRYGGRRSQAARLLSPFCPGSLSRFCASEGSSGRGRGRGSDDLTPNPFEPPAPGSTPAGVPKGSGRGKKSGFAERLGVNLEPPPPKADPVPEAPGKPKEEFRKDGSAQAVRPQGKRRPVDDRQAAQKITHLGKQPDNQATGVSSGENVGSGKPSPPPKSKADKTPAVPQKVSEVPSAVGTTVSPAQRKEDKVAQKLESKKETTTSAKTRPSVSKPPDVKVVPKKDPKQDQSSSIKPSKIAVKSMGTDDWMSELSPKKKPKQVEKIKGNDDWLDELSPRSRKKASTPAAPAAWSDELAPQSTAVTGSERPKDSIEDTAVLLSEDKPREDIATVLPAGEPEISFDSPEPIIETASLQEESVSAPVSDDDPAPETPHTSSGVSDPISATGAKSEDEVLASNLVASDSDVAGVESTTQKQQIEEVEITESTLEPDQDMSYQTSVFEKFLSGTEDEAVFATGPVESLATEESKTPQSVQKHDSDGKGLESLLKFEESSSRLAIDAKEQEKPPSLSQPLPTQSPASLSSQEHSTPSEGFSASLMERLGWGSQDTFADPAPQGFSPSPVPQRGPGAAAAQPNPLKSKLAERLGWTGDGDEFDSDDRSRGRRRAPRRRPTDSPYQQRPRAAKLSPEDKRARAFRSAKAMEMALEGRLDEFDPDSVEVPDNIINDFEDETYSREGEDRPSMSGLGLELREDEIPVPEWKGAPHKWHEYHVRDMFHEMGENPKQHEVMDIERIASLEMDPNYMVSFGPPVPWSQLDYNMTPRRFLMKNKGNIMEALKLTGADVTEDDFMSAAHTGLHEFKMWKRWMDSGKKFKGESLHGNVKLEERFMHHLIDSEIPADHPMHSHLKQSVKALEHNAFWSFAKKAQYVQKMVRNALKDPA